MKTGSGGRPWVTLESPKPPPVDDIYRYWMEPPPERSARCAYWERQLARGFRPNRRILLEGYDSTCAWFGVYLWEWFYVLRPRIGEP